ncbi:MAG: hypothetical protein JXB88_23470 [Spirochaetales bacterium]|nr:hypothetical protein [Spirochaetales bacterium]
MEIYFFSDNTTFIKHLSPLKESKKYKVSIFGVSEFKKECKVCKKQLLVYIDISGLDEGYEKTLKFLARKENFFFGVVDCSGKIKDVAECFFLGAVDYIRKIETNEEFYIKRFSRVFKYMTKYRKDFVPVAGNERKPEQNNAIYKIPVNGWQGITSGNEYAFSIMFIEIDGEKELEKKYGRKNYKKALSTFINYIRKHISVFNGRIWFWLSGGGIILFPFDGVKCPAVLCGFRLKLYKHIYDVEESPFPSSISFRIALHIGNLLYFTGDTGEIISETINSVFHVGKIFAEPDNFYITSEVFSFAPAQLKDYFIDAGKFEGRNVLRMKHYRFGG